MKAVPLSAGGSLTVLGFFANPGLLRLRLRCLRSSGDDGSAQPVSQEESGNVQRAFSQLWHTMWLFGAVSREQCRLGGLNEN